MKKILSILFLSLFLCSCESSSVRGGREFYMLYFEKTFKDPSSIKIYSEKYTEKDGGKVEWVLDVGGKNSYGGMVRKTYRITTWKSFMQDENGNHIFKSDLKKM